MRAAAVRAVGGALVLAAAGLLTACAAAPHTSSLGSAVTAARVPLRVSAPLSPAPAPAVFASPVVAIAPLKELELPDLLVVAPATLTPAQLAAVRGVVGVTSTLVVDAGPVALPRGTVTALGVDPSTFRAVTPARTASSDALWQSVGRGELLTTFDVATAQAESLGSTVSAAGVPVRLGSFADLQMPGVGAVASSALGQQLHLVPGAGLVVSAPSRDVVGLRTDVAKLLPGATVEMLRPVLPSGRATMGKSLYVAAAKTCPGLDWSVLAAIGGIESAHGADTGVSPAGAEGPMQFLPATFEEYATDGDHDGKAVITDPADAVYSAAKLLCHDGAGAGPAQLRSAVFDYNHAGWYVDAVLQLAGIYARED